MNVRLKRFSEGFSIFMKHSGKHAVFTALLYAIWLARACVLSEDFILHSFSGRMIGICTIYDYDVAARVALFYKSISLLIFSFACFLLLAYFFSRKFPALLSGPEMRILNYSALLGIFLILFDLFGFRTLDSMELVYFVQKLMLAAFLLKLLFPASRLTLNNYMLVLLTAVPLYFLVADCYNFLGQFRNPDFLIPTFVICCLLLIGLHLLLKKRSYLEGQACVNRYAFFLAPLSLLPLLSVLKDEAFLVLHAHQLSPGNPLPLYVLLLVLLGCWIFTRYRKSKSAPLVSQNRLIALYYLPTLIFSLITYVNYKYYINYTDEVFEAGNKYLPIMEFRIAGVIPTLEKLNSHLLSDYFFSAIYTLFNGLQGKEMELYDFLNASFSYTLYYYLIYYITRNAFWSAFCILLFPLSTAMLPEGFGFAALSVMALQALLIREGDFKKYIWFFIAMVGTVLWRIDLGYACVIAMIIVLLYYHLASSTFRINWKLLLKAGLTVGGTLLILVAAFSLYRHINLFRKLLHALSYFDSAQTYGYTEIGPKELYFFKMHYYVYPALVAIIVIALVMKFRELNRSRSQRIAYVGLLFSCLFYFANFNRGLVRHSLVENYDFYTSSLIYLILPGSVFVFFKSRPQAFKAIVFCSITFLMITNYKRPEAKELRSFMELGLEKIDSTENMNLNKIGKRVRHEPTAQENPDRPFIEFIARHTKPEETFIDFCNSPMLYYYTKKITPSYFYQNPACSHNDYLQNVFIEDLKDYSTPYLLFSRHDDLSRDMLDEVPNSLRHYRMAEYFFQHFKPYVLAGILSAWKRNDVKDENPKRVLYTFKKPANASPDSLIKTSFKVNPGKKYTIQVALENKIPVIMTAVSDGIVIPNWFEFQRDTVAYTLLEPKGRSCTLSFEKKAIYAVEVCEYKYTPDFRSHKFAGYQLYKLPYIWVHYGKGVDHEKVLFEKKINHVVKENHRLHLEIPEQLDRTSGNTVVISCRNSSKEIKVLTLQFGNKQERDRTYMKFEVLPSDKEEKYAIRISSMYKWYSDTINVITLSAEPGSEIPVSNIQITKGQ